MRYIAVFAIILAACATAPTPTVAPEAEPAFSGTVTASTMEMLPLKDQRHGFDTKRATLYTGGNGNLKIEGELTSNYRIAEIAIKWYGELFTFKANCVPNPTGTIRGKFFLEYQGKTSEPTTLPSGMRLVLVRKTDERSPPALAFNIGCESTSLDKWWWTVGG